MAGDETPLIVPDAVTRPSTVYGDAVTQVIDVPGMQLLRFERQMTDAEYTAFLDDSAAQIEGALKVGTRKIVMLIDVNNATRGTPMQRKAQAEWQERFADYFKRYVICGIFLADSAIIRGAIRAVGWLNPYPYPTRVVADIEAAIKVGQELLQKEGEPGPSQEELQRFRSLYR